MGNINVTVYTFLPFSDLTCHFNDKGISISSCTVPPDTRRPNLEEGKYIEKI